MPIEIRELHIRVAVEAKPEPQKASGKPAAAGAPAGDRDAIIAECVDEVLRVIRSKGER